MHPAASPFQDPWQSKSLLAWSTLKAEDSKVYMTLLQAGFCNRAMWTLSNALLFSSLFLTKLCHILRIMSATCACWAQLGVIYA